MNNFYTHFTEWGNIVQSKPNKTHLSLSTLTLQKIRPHTYTYSYLDILRPDSLLYSVCIEFLYKSHGKNDLWCCPCRGCQRRWMERVTPVLSSISCFHLTPPLPRTGETEFHWIFGHCFYCFSPPVPQILHILQPYLQILSKYFF